MTSDAPKDWPRQVAIIGVGLLGGSVALALRRARPQVTTVGYARSPARCQSLVDSGIVDSASSSIAEVSRESDVIVVATPVDLIAPIVIEAAAASNADCLITDVGSTKERIVAAVALDPVAKEKFVAAHPIAGSEKSGAQHATATLMDGKVVVLTPAPDCPPSRLQKAADFWQLTGGITRPMSPEQHDAHLAAVSHVPHLVSALVATMAEPESRPLVGSGWQDITRVAAGDPTMWTAICQENRDAICSELDKLADQLDRLRQIIRQRDDEALHAWLTEAQQTKQSTT